MIRQNHDKLEIWVVATIKMDRQLIYLILDNFGVKRFWDIAQSDRDASDLKEILRTDLGKAFLHENVHNTYG